MINLFKQTKSNFYSMDFRLNGKRIKKSTGQTDKKAAMAVAMEEYTRLKAEADDMKIGKGVISLADAFDVVIKGVAGSKSTEKNYKWAKNKTLGFGLFAKHHHLPQDLMLHELTQEMLDDLIANRRDEGMKPNSINVELRVLRAVVNKFKGTHKAPAINGIKTIKGFVKTLYLSDKEEAAVLAKLSGMEGVGAGNAYDLCVFLLDTGCRLSEALNTEWDMLDLDLGEYEVYRNKTQSHDVIPLSPRLVEILNRRRNYAKPFVSMD